MKYLPLMALLLLSACASVPMSSPEEDKEAKKFQVPTGQSRLYMFMKHDVMSVRKFPILIDGKMAGELKSKVYMFWDLLPGDHNIMCLSEKNHEIKVSTKADTITYIYYELKSGGWAPRCELHIVDAVKGQEEVNQINLATPMSLK